jgi:hypothetical protein
MARQGGHAMRKVLALSGLTLVTSLIAVLASAPSSQGTTFNPFFGPTDFYRLDPLTRLTDITAPK